MKPKSFDIPKALVWEAYEHVKANGGAAGVDHETIEKFEERLGDNIPPAEEPKRAIVRNSTSPLWRRDSNEKASGKPRAVHYVGIDVCLELSSLAFWSKCWFGKSETAR